MVNSPFDMYGMRQQPDSRGACVRIDMAVIAQNIRSIKAALGRDVRMMAVVKANAYGHGLLAVAKTAARCGVDYLGVAVPEEGVALRENGISLPCLVLGNISAQGAKMAARYQLTQTICDAAGVQCLQRACEEEKTTAQVHIKLDTGMSRIGARTSEDVAEILCALKKADRVRLTGAFTHFANAGDAASVKKQYQRFAALIQPLPREILLHAAASEAALKYPDMRLDMARIGIAMYGGEGEGLQQAMRWETQIAYVKDIQAGDCVSYGGTFCADGPMRIATIAVGYGDGYLRAFSGKGCVLIHGVRCPVLGRVCMDQTMVDVTHVPEAAQGDEVVLLGSQGEARITAQEMAQWADTISYEAFMLHAGRVPVIIENQE